VTNKQKKIFALLAGVIFISLVITAVWYKTTLPENFAEVKSGVLYRSSQGNRIEFQNAIDRYHIKTILCLRELKPDDKNDWFDTEKYVAEKNNVTFIHWPMDSRKPFSKNYWIDFLKMIKNPDRSPILVHCAQGKHRTGFFVALYRMGIDGWSYDQVWNEMKIFDFGDTHPEILETLKKINPEQLRKEVNEIKE
jgi:protein tyrosine/serine phosphatase